jgi:hypothetical protein
MIEADFRKRLFVKVRSAEESRFDFGDEINRGGFKDFVGPQKKYFYFLNK